MSIEIKKPAAGATGGLIAHRLPKGITFNSQNNSTLGNVGNGVDFDILDSFLDAFYPNDDEAICLRVLPVKNAPDDGLHVKKNREVTRRGMRNGILSQAELIGLNKTSAL